MATPSKERYDDLMKRTKKKLYEQYRRIMEEHNYVVLPYNKVTKDDMIFHIVFHA